MDDKLKLKNVKVIFANIKDEGFGRSIVIDATDNEVKIPIEEWVKKNNIGKGSNAGKPNFKEYEPEEGNKVTQYSFKINDYTKFFGKDGLTVESLGYGAEVSLIAQAFEYDNKFGSGTSSNLSAVLIEKEARTPADDDLEELLADSGIDPSELKKSEPEKELEPIDEQISNSGYEAAKATAQSLKPEKKEEKAVEWNDGDIDLESIPF